MNHEVRNTLRYLVQEILHGYFSLFHCSCKLSYLLESQARILPEGFDLHWQTAACAFEMASRRPDIAIFPLNLRGMHSLALYVQCVATMPESSTSSQGELD
jgi:hypothetical protein